MRFFVTLLIIASFCCSNIVAEAAPQGGKGAKRGTLATAPACVTLPAQSIKSHNVSIKVASEPVEITLSDAWFGIVGNVCALEAKKLQDIAIWAEPNFSTAERRGEVVITGKKSGKSQRITIAQPPYLTQIKEAFPARLSTKRYTGDKWVSDGIDRKSVV